MPGSHQQSRPQSRNDSTSLLQQRAVREHAPALAHRDVVRGVEARRREVAERADVPPVDGRADRVAAVLDEPQLVRVGERLDGVEVERVAERVRHHDRARAVAEAPRRAATTSMLYVGSVTSTNTGTSPFWTIGLTVVGKPAATVITSSPGRSRRSPRRGEVSAVSARRFADEPELTSRRVAQPEEPREVALERRGVASGRQPELETGVDQELQLGRVEDPSGDRHRRPAGDERRRGEREIVVLGDELEDQGTATIELGVDTDLGRHRDERRHLAAVL